MIRGFNFTWVISTIYSEGKTISWYNLSVYLQEYTVRISTKKGPERVTEDMAWDPPSWGLGEGAAEGEERLPYPGRPTHWW